MKNKMRGELAVCGFKSVKRLCEKNPQKVERLYFSAERAQNFSAICKILAQKNAPYNQVSDFDLEKLCKSVHHQGAVAFIKTPKIARLGSVTIEKWIKNGENAVFLDGVGNANNFGAIVRSASFFGVKNFILKEENVKSLVTTSAYRTAQGGMEDVELYFVRDATFFLKNLHGKMLKVGTDLKAKKNICEVFKNPRKMPCVVILGSEEIGISKEIRALCDELCIIPGVEFWMGEKNVQSLNVAQAASIILWEMMKR